MENTLSLLVYNGDPIKDLTPHSVKMFTTAFYLWAEDRSVHQILVPPVSTSTHDEDLASVELLTAALQAHRTRGIVNEPMTTRQTSIKKESADDSNSVTALSVTEEFQQQQVNKERERLLEAQLATAKELKKEKEKEMLYNLKAEAMIATELQKHTKIVLPTILGHSRVTVQVSDDAATVAETWAALISYGDRVLNDKTLVVQEKYSTIFNTFTTAVTQETQGQLAWVSLFEQLISLTNLYKDHPAAMSVGGMRLRILESIPRKSWLMEKLYDLVTTANSDLEVGTNLRMVRQAIMECTLQYYADHESAPDSSKNLEGSAHLVQPSTKTDPSPTPKTPSNSMSPNPGFWMARVLQSNPDWMDQPCPFCIINEKGPYATRKKQHLPATDGHSIKDCGFLKFQTSFASKTDKVKDWKYVNIADS